MFANIPFEKKMVIINFVLFTAIAVFAVMTVTEERTIPEKPPIEIIQAIIAGEDRSGETIERTDIAPQFGKAPIFATLIALPTPTPTPVPEPPPDPPLAEAIKSWKVKGIDSGVVFIQDVKTRQDFIMDIDNPDDLQIVRYRNDDLEVRLKSIDESNFSAVFSYDGPNDPEQTHPIGMFD